MSFTNFLASELLDHLFTDGAYSPPATLYIGLSSTTPNEDGTNVTEPSGGSYARVATTAADWAAATSADPSVKTTTAVKSFPQASANWVGGSNLTHFLLFDADTAGNLLAFGALTTPKPVLSGDTASFASGALSLSLD
jgi:hypothetical protein